jgi:hypothetical protein
MFFLYELGTRPSEVKEATEEETQIKKQNIELYEAFVKMAIGINLNAESNSILNQRT